MTGALPSDERRPAGEALLWDASGSPFCAKARMCLQLKGVPYRRVPLTVGRLLALRRVNPRGQVPVLVHGGQTIPDSTAIARHLDASVGGRRLLPADASARAYCELVEDWADEALAPLIAACTWLNPANRAAVLERTVPELAGGWPQPLVARLLVLRVVRRLRGRGFTTATLDTAIDGLRSALGTLEALLADRDHLLGRTPTLADVAAFAQLAGLRDCAERALIAEQPAVAAWMERMYAVPAIGDALG